MNKVSETFNDFIKAWEDLKEAQKKMKVGEMCAEEFFDIDYHFDEIHRKFIEEIQKIN